MNKFVILFLATVGLVACHSGSDTQQNKEKVSSTSQEIEKKKQIPAFNRDSAFFFLKKQCDFGPRVPNTTAHRECGNYLAEELRRLGAEVIEQTADLKAYDGTMLKSKNIIGLFYPEKKRRVILFAHWDSRPFCDNDPDPANHRKPVMGANDGASGVGVLLEIARQLQKQEPNVGVDIVFLDAEDYGRPYFATGEDSNSDNTWCLGAQYWGRNPHYTIKPQYGILLDMVGGYNPEFSMDAVSQRYAPHVLSKVWGKAKELGYGDWFKNQSGGNLIDDHVYINQLTGIPTIDIIDYKRDRGFPVTWHTVNDVPENIDTDVLYMVGNTLMHVIYSE